MKKFIAFIVVTAILLAIGAAAIDIIKAGFPKGTHCYMPTHKVEAEQ